MFEYEIYVDKATKYCPLCDEVHELSAQKRIVFDVIGDRPVRYTEFFNRCDKTNYEITINKALEELKTI